MIQFLEKLKKGQLLALTIGSYILYFMLSIFAPVLTICIKYGIFQKGTDTKVGLGGLGVCLALTAAVVAMFVLRKSVKKLHDTTPGAAHFKYALETVSSLILPVVALIVLRLLKADFSLAYSTFSIMLWFYIAAGLFNGLFISYVDRERNLRDEAARQKEVAKRSDLV